MIKNVVIDSIEGIMELIMDQKYNPDIDRYRTASFYRGMPDSNYKLTTSLRRNCKHKSAQLERFILRNFTKYASIEDNSLQDNVWKQMMLGQQHGLPTRLMDWTRSPLIALHFANSGIDWNELDEKDAVVWKIDMRDCNRNLPTKYREPLDKDNIYVYSLDLLTSVVDNIDEYDQDMSYKAFVNVEPPSVDQRIINQYSFFSIIPNGISDLEEFLEMHTEKTVRYIIKKEIRWQVRDLLDQYNISERIIYPGLDGLSKSLARHFFVKDKNYAELEDSKKK